MEITIKCFKNKNSNIWTWKISKNIHFTFQNNELEIAESYKYLGIYLSRTGTFAKAKKHIAEQANKALFSLLKKIRLLSLPYDIQIDLFDKLVKPILLYGCEIWGSGNIDILERIQLKFYKSIFNLKTSTPSYMIYGELGITPLYIDAQTRMVSFWSNLIENHENFKLLSCIYSAFHALHKEKRSTLSGSIWFQIFYVCMGSLVFGTNNVLQTLYGYRPPNKN